jgi:hypothetical protein
MSGQQVGTFWRFVCASVSHKTTNSQCGATEIMMVRSRLIALTLLALPAFSLSDTSAQPGFQRGSERNQRRPRTVNATPSPSRSNTSKPSSEEPEPEVVRVETNLVNTVFTAVDRDRHFITTLRANDLRIYEKSDRELIKTQISTDQ